MSAPVRAVIFDRDGVLVRTDLAALLRDLMKHLPLGEPELRRRWRAFVGDRPLGSHAEESGTARAFLQGLATELDLPDEARAQVTAFDHGAYVEAYDDAGPALDEIRGRGLKIGVLTNNTAGLSADGPLIAAGLHARIDVALSAQQIGAHKPDPRAYLAMCEGLGADPACCVFFDNTLDWVKGARNAGMRAYQVDRAREDHDLGAGVLANLASVPAALDLESSR